VPRRRLEAVGCGRVGGYGLVSDPAAARGPGRSPRGAVLLLADAAGGLRDMRARPSRGMTPAASSREATVSRRPHVGAEWWRVLPADGPQGGGPRASLIACWARGIVAAARRASERERRAPSAAETWCGLAAGLVRLRRMCDGHVRARRADRWIRRSCATFTPAERATSRNTRAPTSARGARE